MDKKTLVKKISAFAKEVSHEFPLKKMILFGSTATRNAGKHSDVDLLVVSEKFNKKRRLERSPPLYLRWDLGYPVDFICLTPQEFERKKKHFGIVQQAVKEGIEIA